MKSCTACTLHEGRTQVVVGDYGPKQGICFIGEGPGRQEDEQGRPFVGRSGKLLDKMLHYIDLTRDDVSVLNIVKCRPPNNRNPTEDERETCTDRWLETQLNHLSPQLIVTLGSVALNHFIPRSKITKINATLQFTQSGIPIFPLLHPSYILRGGNTREKQYKNSFDKLNLMMEKLQESADNIAALAKGGKNAEQKGLDEYF